MSKFLHDAHDAKDDDTDDDTKTIAIPQGFFFQKQQS